MQCNDFAQFLKLCTTRTGSPGAIILRAEKSVAVAEGGDDKLRAAHLVFALASAFQSFQGFVGGEEEDVPTPAAPTALVAAAAGAETGAGVETGSPRRKLALLTPALCLVQNVHRRYAEDDTSAFSFADLPELPICATGAVCKVLSEHGCVKGGNGSTSPLGAAAKAASVVAADLILKRLRENGCEINAMDLEHVLWVVSEGREQ